MNKKIKITFLALVLVQGLHSIEEYAGRLWEVYAPARFLTGLVSNNHETGFIIIDIVFFLFGLLCWFAVVRNYSFAGGLIWFWIISETINSIGHSVWALDERGYVPGVATAPIILLLALYLAWLSVKTNHITVQSGE